MALLPSHLLGMSRWIYAEDCCISKEIKLQKNGKLPEPKPGDTLRRFRYSYYMGLFEVDTLHIFVEQGGTINNEKEREKKFRIVEYFDCPISPWIVFYGTPVLLVTFVVHCLNVCGACSSQISSLVLPSALTVAVMYCINRLTGVQVVG